MFVFRHFVRNSAQFFAHFPCLRQSVSRSQAVDIMPARTELGWRPPQRTPRPPWETTTRLPAPASEIKRCTSIAPPASTAACTHGSTGKTGTSAPLRATRPERRRLLGRVPDLSGFETPASYTASPHTFPSPKTTSTASQASEISGRLPVPWKSPRISRMRQARSASRSWPF